jgi:hypothetical protein
MKIYIKMLACAISGSLVFMACGDHNWELDNLHSGLNPVGSSSHESSSSAEVSGIAFKVQYRQGQGNLGFSGKPIAGITIVSSKDEIEQYYGKNEVKIWDKQDNCCNNYKQSDNTTEKYSDDFFADNFLVIVELAEPSGSIRHKVERIYENGDIFIRRLVPEIGTDDIGSWGIIIELNNNFKIDKFHVVFVDVNSGKSVY